MNFETCLDNLNTLMNFLGVLIALIALTVDVTRSGTAMTKRKTTKTSLWGSIVGPVTGIFRWMIEQKTTKVSLWGSIAGLVTAIVERRTAKTYLKTVKTVSSPRIASSLTALVIGITFVLWIPVVEVHLRGLETGLGVAEYGTSMDLTQSDSASQDDKPALEQLRIAAEQEDANAQNSLGAMYYAKAEAGGAPQDYEDALKWFRRAAKQGDANAQYNLGVMYSAGQGVMQDYKTALEWFRRAAEQGDADAQYNLGLMHYGGYGVPRDNVGAHMWFSIAALSGDEEAPEYRDEVAKEMTLSQLKEAKDLALAGLASRARGTE